MVSGLTITFMCVTFILSFILPFGLVVFYYRKHRISLVAVLVGALMFFLFQVLLRIPALTIIQSQSWYQPFMMGNMVLTGMIIAFSAALFETAGRYIGLKFLLRKKLERKNGIAYGIGHGGIEAILLVGISYMMNVVYSILINNGVVSSTLIPQLINTPSILFLLAGIERAFAILFHIAAALLVTYGIMSNRKVYILYSLIFHAILDGVVVLFQIGGVSIWITELWVALAGLLSLVFIIKSKYMFEMLPDRNH